MEEPGVNVDRLIGERFLSLSQDLMCVSDGDRQMVATNPAFQTVLGWSAEDLAGISCADLTHPDDREATQAAHLDVLAGNNLVDFVNRFRRSDGTYLSVLWTASLDSETGLIYAIGKDVADRKEMRFPSIVDQSDDAIIGKDRDLRVTTWNGGAERMYGYSAEQMIGQPFGALIPSECDGEDRALIDRVLAGETVDHVETVRLHQDGTRLDVSVSVSPIRDLTGRIIGASSIARDIAESKALARAQGQVIERLLIAAEFRDDTTSKHGVRMSCLCGQIAKVLGWSPGLVSDIESAAAMHDVGKIAIPDSVLLKPGPLTDDERVVMQSHAEVGERMLSGTGIGVIDRAAEIALTHHERFDGSGYPRGLAGEEIPLSGRIAAAADVFDALTSDRVYRPAFTRGKALAMMNAGSGTQFDPTALEALVEALAA
jgi:putative two-component system response regulator